MKSFKKILAFALVLMLALSTCVIAVSADDAAPEADTKIHFEVPEKWGEASVVFCHIWVYGGDDLSAWQAKAEKCTDEGNGKWSYDPAKVGGLEDDTYYGVIFSVNTGMQTYDTLMTTECLGDTLYVSENVVYENPQDSSKTCDPAFWRNQDSTAYGPIMQITSIGNLIGTCLPPDITAEDMFSAFLSDWLESARTYSEKNDQQIIDDIITALELTADEAEAIIDYSGVIVSWSKNGASTNDESTPDEKGLLGDANADGVVNVKDATLIQKAVAGLVSLDETAELVADADLNGTVNVKDATAIQKYVAGLSVSTPIGELL